MGTHDVDNYVFTALDDFSRLSDLDSKLNSAKEFGIRIVECKGLQWNDWRVKKGPLLRFRRRASDLLFGNDSEDRFFIRKVEAHKNSNIRLYYHEIATGKDAIIEIKRKPGLCLTFRTGRDHDWYIDVFSRCTREKVLRFITLTECYDVK